MKTPFNYKLLDDPTTDSLYIQVIKPSSDDRTKWQVTCGQSNFHVRINDMNFLAIITSNFDSLLKDDILCVKIKHYQYIEAVKCVIKTESVIEEVLSHFRGDIHEWGGIKEIKHETKTPPPPPPDDEAIEKKGI